MVSPGKTPERCGEIGPSRSRSRRRRAFLLAVLGATTLLFAGSKAAPRVEARIALHQAERDIAAGRFDEARDRLARLISREPKSTVPRLLLARVAREQGQITEAEEVLQRALDLGLPIEQARPEHELIRRAVRGPQSTKTADRSGSGRD